MTANKKQSMIEGAYKENTSSKESTKDLKTKNPQESSPDLLQSTRSFSSGTTPSTGNLPFASASSKKKGPTTRITVKFDVGFSNALYLRGKGANLSWDKGVLLKNIKSDEWVWESDASFNSCEFKVLINDKQYEAGENHPLTCGTTIQYTPKF